jgi:hypothetical protein
MEQSEVPSDDRRCAKCAALNPATNQFCGKCGGPFQTAPLRNSDAAVPATPTAAYALTALVIGLVLISYAYSGDKSNKPVSPITTSYTLGRAGALCGKEELATVLAYQALQRGDNAGVVGLASRGEVDYLEAGTTVDVFYYGGDGGLSKVSVTSGSSLSKQCWIPARLLTAR